MSISLRKALNLTESWLLTVVDEDTWNNEFKPILTSNEDDEKRLREVRERWKDPSADGKGEFNLVRHEQPVSSNFNIAMGPQ